MIGADARPIPGIHRVQRIEAEERRAGAAGPLPGKAEGRKVADALIAAPAQRIELG